MAIRAGGHLYLLQPETSFVPGIKLFTHAAIDHNGNSGSNAFGISGYLLRKISRLLPSLSMAGLQHHPLCGSSAGGQLESQQILAGGTAVSI
jgi:hypothetical protein